MSCDAFVQTEVRDACMPVDIDKWHADYLPVTSSCFHDVFIEQRDLTSVGECKVNDSRHCDNTSDSLHDDWTVCCLPKP